MDISVINQNNRTRNLDTWRSTNINDNVLNSVENAYFVSKKSKIFCTHWKRTNHNKEDCYNLNNQTNGNKENRKKIRKKRQQ